MKTLSFFMLWLASLAALENRDGERWWSHVKFLASDELRGRETGTPEHRRAAEYVAQQFAAAGLAPAGTAGYMQPISFRARRIVEEKSSLTIVRDGKREPVLLGEQAVFSMRVEPPPQVEAPLVFAGYGLRVPEVGYDDLAGLDLRGKVAVYFTGGPTHIPGPLLAHYQAAGERWSSLKRAGATGIIAIQNPQGQDVPWERSKLARFLPAMELSDPDLHETPGLQLSVTFNPEHAARLFGGTGHEFMNLLAAAKARKPLPRFPIPGSVLATVSFVREERESPNVVGVLPGSDPRLKGEYVVLSAHLDHVGVGKPINGDEIYNGAMDNASGIATLIETARLLKESKTRLRRSVVFLAVTAEEKGLLGSRYYAAHPTVPREGIVANLNTDMFSPFFPLTSLIVQGLEESDLAGDLRKVASALGVQVLSDPEPERNAFTRSDQYSFIRKGFPLSLKVGFIKGSPEHEYVQRWRKERYHAPSDDVNQPVDLKAAADFNRLYARAVEEVANRESRPRWNDASFFRRFASPTSAAPAR